MMSLPKHLKSQGHKLMVTLPYLSTQLDFHYFLEFYIFKILFSYFILPQMISYFMNYVFRIQNDAKLTFSTVFEILIHFIRHFRMKRIYVF